MFRALTKFRFLAATLMAVTLVGCAGGSGPVVTGTGEIFNGGGAFAKRIRLLRETLLLTFKLLEKGHHRANFCTAVTGLNDEQREGLRNFLARVNAGIQRKIETPIKVVPGPLVVVDKAGTRYVVEARYSRQGDFIEVDEAFFDAKGAGLVSHELAHAAPPEGESLYDFAPWAPYFLASNGRQEGLDAFGECVAEARERLVMSPAELFTEFGVGGHVRANGNTHGVKTAETRDGKILVGRTLVFAAPDGAHYRAYLTRRNADGSVDTTFGTDGQVEIPNGIPFGTYGGAAIEKVLVGPDGKILIVGWVLVPGGRYIPLIAQYSPDGDHDLRFHNNAMGYVNAVYTVSQFYRDAFFEKDGSITVYGSFATTAWGLAVYRWNSDGTPIPQPAGANARVYSVPGIESAVFQRVAVDSSNRRILLGAGRLPGATEHSTPWVMRHTASLEVDTTFGTNGSAYPKFGVSAGSYVKDLAVEPDGKIVVAGWYGYGSDTSPYNRPVVLRLQADGQLDVGFGVGGRSFPLTSVVDAGIFHALVRDTDGRYVLGGQADINGSTDGIVVRLKADGQLDESFDDRDRNKGAKRFSVVAGRMHVLDLRLLSSGRILAGSTTQAVTGPYETVLSLFEGGHY